jgi:hypothetical protein
MRPPDLAGAAAAGCLAAIAASSLAEAQPAPSFRASCQELRASLGKLGPKPDDYFTIEVVGTLRDVQSDGALVYMLMCAPPDPQVLCVTYSTNDRKKGDTVILAGTYNERGPDHVMLDPCLHHAPEDDLPGDAGEKP